MRDFPVPTTLSERALAWLDAARTVEVTDPRPAATVLLVRDGVPGRVEVFLLRRRTTMAFAAGMHVFPGGGVDPRDAAADVPWAGPPASWWADHLGVEAGTARALVSAAVRETFEECGVLLADAGGLAADLTAPCWEGHRRALVDKDESVAEVLAAHDLVLRSDLLRPWAHWTTPAFEPRRYDTWFFLAALPAGQDARHVGGEASESAWRPAVDALDDVAAGRALVLPPTLVCLEEVAAARDVAELLATERDLTEVVPELRRDDDGAVVMRTDLRPSAGGGAR